MRGIYIGITPRNVSTIWTPGGKPTADPVYTIPPGRRTFEYLFEPLADAMRPLHWWVSHGGFSGLELYERLGEEAYDDYGRAVSDRGASRGDTFLYPAGALPEHADCVANDWAHMVGLDERDGDPFAAAQRLDAGDWGRGHEAEQAYYALLAETSPLCFYCVDGFVWEVYMRDTARLERFAEHLRSAPHSADRFHLQFGELCARDRWYFWGGQAG